MQQVLVIFHSLSVTPCTRKSSPCVKLLAHMRAVDWVKGNMGPVRQKQSGRQQGVTMHGPAVPPWLSRPSHWSHCCVCIDMVNGAGHENGHGRSSAGRSEWMVASLLTSELFHNLFSFVILTCVVFNVAQVSVRLLAATGSIQSLDNVVAVILYCWLLWSCSYWLANLTFSCLNYTIDSL